MRTAGTFGYLIPLLIGVLLRLGPNPVQGNTLPTAPPSATINYNQNSQILTFSVNVTYMSGSGLQYAYSFDFLPWSTLSSLYTPDACTNRRSSQFNTTQPRNWNSIWNYAPTLSAAAIAGTYTAWPLPGTYWSPPTIALLSKNLVNYQGTFTIDKIAGCGGSNALTVTVSGTTITYVGVFYVNWVQPRDPPASPTAVLTATYNTITYSFPFSFTVNRQAQALTAGSQITSMFAYLASVQVLPTSTVGSNYLSVSIQTRTPPSMLISPVAVANYNDLTLASITNLGVRQPPMSLNTSASARSCSVNSLNYCVQTWALYSSTQASAVINGSWALNFIIQNCNVTRPSQCTATSLTCSVNFNIASLEASVSTINSVNAMYSNLTYYTSGAFTKVRQTNSYLPSETVWIKHQAFLGPINANFYSLSAYDIYVCSPVPGGYPPLLGFDPVLHITRTGCSAPETISGVTNIPASNIFHVLTSGVVTLPAFKYNSTRTANMPKSAIGLSFASDALRQQQLTSAYIQINSLLTPATIAYHSWHPRVSTQDTRQQHVNDHDADVDHAAGAQQWLEFPVRKEQSKQPHFRGQSSGPSSTVSTKHPMLRAIVARPQNTFNPSPPNGNSYNVGSLGALNITLIVSQDNTKVVQAIAISTSVVGFLIVLAIVIGLVIYCRHKRKERDLEQEKKQQEMAMHRQIQDKLFNIEKQIKKPAQSTQSTRDSRV